MPKLSKGLVQIYTGNGKGKTTAVFGLAMRAAGWGMRTYIAQFLKSGATGEYCASVMLSPYVTVEQFGNGHFVTEYDYEQSRLASKGLSAVWSALVGGEYDIVVAEEINVVLALDLLPIDAVLECIGQRPPNVELILTGRDAPPVLIERADLVTEMVAVKHPFERGIGARKGIEF